MSLYRVTSTDQSSIAELGFVIGWTLVQRVMGYGCEDLFDISLLLFLQRVIGCGCDDLFVLVCEDWWRRKPCPSEYKLLE